MARDRDRKARMACAFGGGPCSRVPRKKGTNGPPSTGVPRDGKWPMRKSPGTIRLHALPASDVWHARTGLTLYAVEPRSTVTVTLNAAGLRAGNIAGLALLGRPCGWLGVERRGNGLTVSQFDERSGRLTRVPLRGPLVQLRAECDFVRHEAGFRYSADGKCYAVIGEPYILAHGSVACQDVSCSLFSYATKAAAEGGHADFDSFVVITERHVA